MSKTFLMGIGLVVGLGLLALAGLAFATAAAWSGVARDGAMVGYNLVGIFLTIAGLGSIIATWNQNYRIADQPAGH